MADEIRTLADEDVTSDNLGKNKVTIGNEMVRAQQKLTLSEKRILSASVSLLSPNMKVFPKRGIRLTAAQYAETFNLDMTTAYEQLEAAGDALFDREWSYTTGKIRVRRRWVQEIRYHKGEGWLEVHFAPKIAPNLLQLSKQFTTYHLQLATALRLPSSWRIMENFERFVDAKTGEGIWNIDIDDFHELLDTKPSLRKNFAQLDRRVIKPCLEELRKHWTIVFIPKKKGRRISLLSFKFSRNPQATMDV